MEQTTFAANVIRSGCEYIEVLEAESTRLRCFPARYRARVLARYGEVRWVSGIRLCLERNCREMPVLRTVGLAEMAASA